ncbi:hypothetical protein L596_010228 [Steinernema carpocapsae]|uniref:Uncharacterized protein n=1 Tax=Steinernema carpocapsae TaxID=34508 RepID=A0A4U5PHQ5_STECR|nr:hypothetical protein L596_010228 [Steinernema carpocapsae]
MFGYRSRGHSDMTAKTKPKNLAKKKYEVEYESLPDDRIQYLREQNRRKQSTSNSEPPPPQSASAEARKMSFEFLPEVYQRGNQNWVGDEIKACLPDNNAWMDIVDGLTVPGQNE